MRRNEGNHIDEKQAEKPFMRRLGYVVAAIAAGIMILWGLWLYTTISSTNEIPEPRPVPEDPLGEVRSIDVSMLEGFNTLQF